MGFSSSTLLTIAGINLFLGYVMGLFFGDAFRNLSLRFSLPRLSLPRISFPRRAARDAAPAQVGTVEKPEPERLLPQPVPDNTPVQEDVEPKPIQEKPQPEPPEEPPAPPTSAAIAASIVAVMSSVDRPLLVMESQLREAAGNMPDQLHHLAKTLQARAQDQVQVLRNCVIHLHGVVDQAPQHQAAIDSLSHAEQQVEAIVAELSGTDADESCAACCGRLLDETFQVQFKLEQLMVAWLAAKNSELIDAIKATAGGADGILGAEDHLSKWSAANPDRSLMALQIDYDLLGRINDEYGSLVTDLALDELQKLIRGLIPTDDLVGECELSGRHLLFFVAQEKSSSEELAERIRQSIDASKLSMRGVPLRLTASVALATVTSGIPLGETYQRLRVARDAAKEFGRNSTYFWKESEPAIVLPAGVDVPNWQIELDSTPVQTATLDNENQPDSPRSQ